MPKYIVIRDFTTPVPYRGAHPSLGTNVKPMTFKKGKVIDGELSTNKAGEPEFILYKKCVIIPIAAVRQLVTKTIESSSADGTGDTTTVEKKVITESTNKVKFIDAAIVGGLIGLAVVWFAQKKGWIPEENPEVKIPHQNKLVGILIGAAAGAYWTYKKNIKTGVKVVKDKTPQKG